MPVLSTYDTGFYNGQLVSLAGVRGKSGRGLRLDTSSGQVVVAGVYQPIANSNPARLWLLLTNDSLANLIISFAGPTGYLAEHVINPAGNLLINQNMPWTGDIWMKVSAVMGTGELYNLSEASVQP